MNRNVACSSLDQSREPFGNVRVFNLEKGRFDQDKAATFADSQRHFSYIFVCLRTAAAVTNNEDTALNLVFHAATPDSSPPGMAQ
jgi:hypothetical protein